MAYFPVFTDLSQKKCMIFGGGNVALRKIESLLRYNADLEIIARDLLPEMEKILPEERIHLLDLKANDAGESNFDFWLEKADLVIAATSSRSINGYISKWCRQHKILVNVIDAPEECTFLFPSLVKRGEISIGINTAGQSPIVSRKIRKEIEETIPEYYGEIARQLGEMRHFVKENFQEEDKRRRILKGIAGEAFALERPLNEKEIQRIVAES